MNGVARGSFITTSDVIFDEDGGSNITCWHLFTIQRKTVVQANCFHIYLPVTLIRQTERNESPSGGKQATIEINYEN